MLFDSTMLARIAADLRRHAVGARVGRVFHASRHEVVLDLRRRIPRPQILLSWSAEFGRVHLAADARPTPDLHSPFADGLRKHVRGAVLSDARQVGFDRILHLEFTHCAGLGPESRATLVAEIMGRHANLILLDEDRDIIACAKLIGPGLNRYRQTLPGLPYVPPPDFDRIDPCATSPEDLALAAAEHADTPIRKFLRRALMGASDVFLDELLVRSDLPDDAPVDELPADWAGRIARTAADILAEAEAEGPGFICGVAGSGLAPAFAYPLPLQSRPEGERAAADLSEALEDLVSHMRTARDIGQRKERLAGMARRALRKAEARRTQRKRALAEAESGDDLRRRGELILANLHTTKPGAVRITVTDYYDPDQPEVEIDLDPNHSAKDNAQALFARYKRARRIQDRVPPLLAKASRECAYLQGLLEQIELADSPEEMAELEHELHRGGYVGKQARRKRPPPKLGPVEPRRATSPEGIPILYGKTGHQNDALLRIARPDDLWFHVTDGPGGHVLIRTEGRPERLPEGTIIHAAEIAAGLSRWRADSRAGVSYTHAKHVRKPKGAPPGFVLYTRAKQLTVEPRAPR